MSLPWMLVNVITFCVAIAAIATSSTIISTVSLPPIKGTVVGGRILKTTASGELVETEYGPSDLLSAVPETVTRVTSIFSSGAGVLNFTVDVTRRGLYRAWTVSSAVGTLNVSDVLVVDLAGTGLLLPSDMPLLAEDDPVHIAEMAFERNATEWFRGSVRIDGTAQRLTISPPYVVASGDKQDWHRIEGEPFTGVLLNAPIAFRDTFSWYVPPPSSSP